MLQLPNLYLNARENVEVQCNAHFLHLTCIFINLGTFKCENQLKRMPFIDPFFNCHILEPK